METVGRPSFEPEAAAAAAAVVDAAHALTAGGLVTGTSGNLSARAGDAVAVTPTGAELGELAVDEVTLVDLDGAVLRGRLAPTSELALHLEIYRRYAAGAVVHAHPRVATALSCVVDELPCIHPDMLDLGGSVRVAPYRPFGSPDFAAVTVEALRERQAALMSNHGAVAIGGDLAEAVGRLVRLEWVAEVYWHASALGEPRTLSDDQQEALRLAIRRMGYGRTRPLKT